MTQILRQEKTESEIRDPQTYAIIGAAMEVHQELGPGYLEAVYQEALEIEFIDRGVPYQREIELPVIYKGRDLKKKYKADFICYDRVVVEIKAQFHLTGSDEAQAINYLKCGGKEVGLLLNFGMPSLQYHRRVF